MPHGRFNLDTKPGKTSSKQPVVSNGGTRVTVLQAGISRLDNGVSQPGGPSGLTRFIRGGQGLQPIQADSAPFSASAQMSSL